jgi:site-specific recombinase XerD
MARAGIHQRVIQAITGHSNASVLAGYIEVSEEQRKAAIATL